MKQDIKNFTETCTICDRFKKRVKVKAPLGMIPATNKNDLVAIDIVGGKETLKLTSAGNKYILVMIDVFTKYVRAVPLPDQTAKTVADAFLNCWIYDLGAPFRLLSDQGVNFESQVFHNLCLFWHISKVRTTPYHPSSNGVCERVNQTIKHGLQKIMQNQIDVEWDQILPEVIFAYNTAVHESTGFTPFRLNSGNEARYPLQLLVKAPEDVVTPAGYAAKKFQSIQNTFEIVRNNLDAAHKRNKNYYDLGIYGTILQSRRLGASRQKGPRKVDRQT